MGGMGRHYAKKDAEQAALKSRLAQQAEIASLKARLAELEGDQPKARRLPRQSLDTATISSDAQFRAGRRPAQRLSCNDFILGGPPAHASSPHAERWPLDATPTGAIHREPKRQSTTPRWPWR
jgi:hypothetical protein